MLHNDDIKSHCTWPTEKEAISDIRDTVFMVSSGDTFSAGQVRECQSSFLSPDASLSPRMLTQRTAAPSSVVSGHLASHCPRLSYLGPHSTRKIVSWQQNSSEHCLWFPTKMRSWLNFLIIPLKWLAEPGLVSWSVLTTPAISRLDNKTYRRLSSKCIYSVGKVGSSIFHFSFFILIISARSFLYEKN